MDPTKVSITITMNDLENLIRRAVQESVREELGRLFRASNQAAIDYWEHEGPDDTEGDEVLLADALQVLKRYESDPAGWKSLEDFEAEIADDEGNREVSG